MKILNKSYRMLVITALLLQGSLVSLMAQDFSRIINRESPRDLFARAVENKMTPDQVLEIFLQDTLLSESVRLGYIGALQTLKARNALFPLTKLKWLKRGMSTLKKARNLDPLNVEVIFVQGVVCFQVPKILGYRDEALQHFDTLVQLLPNQWQRYESGFVQEMIHFLRTEVELTPEQERTLAQIENQLLQRNAGE